jgi:hypothetical protein
MTLRRWHPADTPHKTAHGEADREPTHAWSIRVSATSRGLRARIEWPRGRQTATLAAGTVRVASRSWGRHRDKEQAQILTSAPSP